MISSSFSILYSASCNKKIAAFPNYSSNLCRPNSRSISFKKSNFFFFSSVFSDCVFELPKDTNKKKRQKNLIYSDY